MMTTAEKKIRPEKREAVELLKGKLANAKGIVLADFTGLTVSEVNELRRKCREAKVEYRVVKNTLARIAAREAQLEDLERHFDGPVAVASSEADSIAPAKVLADFRTTVEKLTLKVGFIEGQLLAPERLREVASLPSREGLLARVIGAIEAPMGQVVWTIEGVLRDLISILDQVAKQKEGSS
jgi:large subunit ribosomal protein L10